MAVFVQFPPAGAQGLDFHVLLDTELGEGFLNAEGGESSRSVGVPALSHHLTHHPERLGKKQWQV